MKISTVSTPIFSQKVPAALLFTFEKARPEGPPKFLELIRPLGKREFDGSEKQLLVLHTAGKIAPQRLVLAGFGKREKFDLETCRRAAGRACRKVQDLGLERIAVQIPESNGSYSVSQVIQAVVEAAILATYQFGQFKSDEQGRPQLKSLILCLPPGTPMRSAARMAKRGRILAESANYARRIGNLPGNAVYPRILADHARRLARDCGLKCTVWGRSELARRKFGGLLAVGSGSARDPQFIVLEYRGGRSASRRPVALVGKAITFDSGGISIKPSERMEYMKFDKCGGVAVLGTLRAVARLRLPVHVLGIVASAENMPGGTSYRPGDIITSYPGAEPRGVTVEVINTDAEGRIVLGDALAYARERNARAIIDLATLTGACVVALGTQAAGLFGNDESLLAKIQAAGDRTGERVWPFPLWPDYRDKVRSDVADIKNTTGREAGAIAGAAFLARYVGDVPWAHLDIAGTAWTTEDRPCYTKGTTGFGVRLLVDLLSEWNGGTP